MHDLIEQKLTALGAEWDRESLRVHLVHDALPHECQQTLRAHALACREAIAEFAEPVSAPEIVGRGTGSVLEQQFRLTRTEQGNE